jgi:hypothetical protein
MTQNRLPAALLTLQGLLGLVILEESLRFVLPPAAAQAFAKTGLPNFVHVGLGRAEIVAAVLFLVPRTAIAGGRFLTVVLGFAIAIHILHGWFDVEARVVYAAAAWTVVAGKSDLLSSEKRA